MQNIAATSAASAGPRPGSENAAKAAGTVSTALAASRRA